MSAMMFSGRTYECPSLMNCRQFRRRVGRFANSIPSPNICKAQTLGIEGWATGWSVSVLLDAVVHLLRVGALRLGAGERFNDLAGQRNGGQASNDDLFGGFFEASLERVLDVVHVHQNLLLLLGSL